MSLLEWRTSVWVTGYKSLKTTAIFEGSWRPEGQQSSEAVIAQQLLRRDE